MPSISTSVHNHLLLSCTGSAPSAAAYDCSNFFARSLPLLAAILNVSYCAQETRRGLLYDILLTAFK